MSSARSSSVFRIGATAGLALLVACDSSSGSNADGGGKGDAAVTSAAIGPQGGSVKTSDNNVEVQIPAGALDQTTTITIAPATAPIAGAIGQAYEIGPTGTQFNQPITLLLRYEPQTLGSTAATSLVIATVSGGQWQPIQDIAVDTSGHSVSGTTTHLSIYALTTPAGQADGGTGPDLATCGVPIDRSEPGPWNTCCTTGTPCTHPEPPAKAICIPAGPEPVWWGYGPLTKNTCHSCGKVGAGQYMEPCCEQGWCATGVCDQDNICREGCGGGYVGQEACCAGGTCNTGFTCTVDSYGFHVCQ